jgi:mRNA interferase RelE/StbE
MPTRYRIIVDRQPRRVIRRLPRNLLERLRAVVDSLADNPRPHGCGKLDAERTDNLWRVREGNPGPPRPGGLGRLASAGWRITYAIEDDRLVIVIVEVAPRGGAYRNS